MMLDLMDELRLDVNDVVVRKSVVEYRCDNIYDKTGLHYSYYGKIYCRF